MKGISTQPKLKLAAKLGKAFLILVKIKNNRLKQMSMQNQNALKLGDVYHQPSTTL